MSKGSKIDRKQSVLKKNNQKKKSKFKEVQRQKKVTVDLGRNAATVETQGELKMQRRGFRSSIRSIELLEGRQDKEMRNSGDKRREQHTALVHSMN